MTAGRDRNAEDADELRSLDFSDPIEAAAPIFRGNVREHRFVSLRGYTITRIAGGSSRFVIDADGVFVDEFDAERFASIQRLATYLDRMTAHASLFEGLDQGADE